MSSWSSKPSTTQKRLSLSIQRGGYIKGTSKNSSDIELAWRFVVEGNGLVVTKQLVLGNLVGKHQLCCRGKMGADWGWSVFKALNILGVCRNFPGIMWRMEKAMVTWWAFVKKKKKKSEALDFFFFAQKVWAELTCWILLNTHPFSHLSLYPNPNWKCNLLHTNKSDQLYERAQFNESPEQMLISLCTLE